MQKDSYIDEYRSKEDFSAARARTPGVPKRPRGRILKAMAEIHEESTRSNKIGSTAIRSIWKHYEEQKRLIRIDVPITL